MLKIVDHELALTPLARNRKTAIEVLDPSTLHHVLTQHNAWSLDHPNDQRPRAITFNACSQVSSATPTSQNNRAAFELAVRR
jgi:hypothetical protein